MPYIHKDQRSQVNPLAARDPWTPGELNFQVTQLIKVYVEAHGLSYATINDVVGALEGAKLEFYRRVAAPYEDRKIIENGDVYGH
jgi:hypothetical protein